MPKLGEGCTSLAWVPVRSTAWGHFAFLLEAAVLRGFGGNEEGFLIVFQQICLLAKPGEEMHASLHIGGRELQFIGSKI